MLLLFLVWVFAYPRYLLLSYGMFFLESSSNEIVNVCKATPLPLVTRRVTTGRHIATIILIERRWSLRWPFWFMWCFCCYLVAAACWCCCCFAKLLVPVFEGILAIGLSLLYLELLTLSCSQLKLLFIFTSLPLQEKVRHLNYPKSFDRFDLEHTSCCSPRGRSKITSPGEGEGIWKIGILRRQTNHLSLC